MRTSLLLCFLALTVVAFGQNERDLIKQIDSINSSALSYFDNNQIVHSFNAFNKAKKLSDSVNDCYGSAISNFHLGNIYSLMKEYESAERSYVSMLKPSKKIGDNFLAAKAYLNLALLKKTKNSTQDDVLVYLNKALAHISKHLTSQESNYEPYLGQTVLLDTRVGLCEFYIENGFFDEALINLLTLDESITDVANLNVAYYNAYYHYMYGQYFLKKELYNNANEKFKMAIASLEETNFTNNNEGILLISEIYKELSLSSAQTGNSNEAYLALLGFNKYKDQFVNLEKIKYDVITKSKFLIEDYKNNAQIANNEKLNQLQIANTIKVTNLVISIALLLSFVCLLVVYRSYNSKRKLTNVLKNQNTQLDLARNEAVKSSELKSKFISNVSHELRTPLYGVIGITSLLLKNNNLSDSDSKLLSSLKYSSDYLLNLINDVLQFGKIEAQEVELKKVSVNLRELIKNNVNSFEYRLKENNNKINIFIDEDVPDFVKSDNVRLSQILINLIGNSAKFTQNGWINIRLKKLKTFENTVNLRFEIEDNGIGIPEEKIDTVFENFSQLDDSNNVNYQGTGLGLSITKKMVELFGSNIELVSEEGVGSTFSFNIAFEIDTDAKSNLNLKKESVKTINFKKKYKILVAEDNKINQVVTKNLLIKENYDCEIVENGLEAISKFKKEKFDLILMDINMPVVDGVKATKIIRNIDAIVPIIALTAADVEHFKADYEGVGFAGMITKPFDNYEFFQTIETCIELSKKTESLLIKVS